MVEGNFWDKFCSVPQIFSLSFIKWKANEDWDVYSHLATARATARATGSHSPPSPSQAHMQIVA